MCVLVWCFKEMYLLPGMVAEPQTVFDVSPTVFFVMGSFHAVEFDFQVQRDHDCWRQDSRGERDGPGSEVAREGEGEGEGGRVREWVRDGERERERERLVARDMEGGGRNAKNTVRKGGLNDQLSSLQSDQKRPSMEMFCTVTYKDSLSKHNLFKKKLCKRKYFSIQTICLAIYIYICLLICLPEMTN